MLHRVAEGGPVTYVFFGQANASAFLLHYAPAPQTPPPPSNAAESAAADINTLPVNALTLKQDWLELILTGCKTWEIRSQPINKRERVALAQSQTTKSQTALLLGDVEIVNCVRLDADMFAASIDKHCVPQDRHTEIIGGYAKIFAWELARPRRYVTPIPYKRVPGQVGWVKLDKQLHIFDNMLVEHVNIENTSTRTPQSQATERQDANTASPAAAPAVETSRPVAHTRTRSQVAAAAAEARVTANSARGIGDAERAEAMQQASQASSSRQGDAPFGASRAWKLREALKGARASAKATIIPPPALAPATQPASVGSEHQAIINITPLEKLRNTCFLNAIIQALRVVCNRLNMNVQPEHACPLSRLLVTSDDVRDDFRQRVRTHPIPFRTPTGCA